jgi:ABC-type lipoprotein export system ATPase subunit
MPASSPLLRLESVHKTRNGKKLLEGVNLEIRRGEVAMVVGKSGSGKTTLLRICALVDSEFSGRIMVDGEEPYLSKKDSYLRLFKIGYVPQFHDLIEQLTVLENVELPLILQGIEKDKCREKALEVIDRLGIKSISASFPSEISGGEAQRVAVARALVKEPDIMIADEPTSSVDDDLEQMIIKELVKISENGGCVFISSTHNNSSYMRYVNSLYFMRDGFLQKKRE